MTKEEIKNIVSLSAQRLHHYRDREQWIEDFTNMLHEKFKSNQTELTVVAMEIYHHWKKLKEKSPSVPNTMLEKLESVLKKYF